MPKFQKGDVVQLNGGNGPVLHVLRYETETMVVCKHTDGKKFFEERFEEAMLESKPPAAAPAVYRPKVGIAWLGTRPGG